ncbi:hypothetical protein PRUPE_4G226800 [Prunus persica]|uniref:Amidohydrolase-related domain-containing protein n=1 Tax=Prunus persica TaxID=3760 RepID=M5WMW0_PRUPE|nr:hypothetical protein PRUPE_4G226800 [Prunus persica]
MNATDGLLLATTDTAKELKTGIHMHVAEIAYENQFVTETQKVDHGTVIHLEKIQFLHDNLLAAHTVWVNPAETDCLSRDGVKVSHCPARCLMLASVSLGTDGAPSNNRMSRVDEMYLASLINKGREVHTNGTTDPTALPAETVLKLNGDFKL